MPGLTAVFWKELADHFGSWRFIILFAVIALAGLSATYVAYESIRPTVEGQASPQFVFLSLFTTSGGVLPSFISFIGFFGPLIGLALGFDAINRERSSGTLSRVLSQPLFRDSVVNGKFLAGVTTIAVMLLAIVLIISGLGLRMIGIPPSFEEVLRITAFLAITIVYVAFWMSLAVLFSILFKRVATSALAGIAVWIFFAFFMLMIAGVLADAIAPLDQQSSATEQIRNFEIGQMVMRMSPTTLFEEATSAILTPAARTLGPVLVAQTVGMIAGPLPFGQSLLLVWPHLTTLIALMLICFAISYVAFLRQEIRAP